MESGLSDATPRGLCTSPEGCRLVGRCGLEEGGEQGPCGEVGPMRPRLSPRHGSRVTGTAAATPGPMQRCRPQRRRGGGASQAEQQLRAACASRLARGHPCRRVHTGPAIPGSPCGGAAAPTSSQGQSLREEGRGLSPAPGPVRAIRAPRADRSEHPKSGDRTEEEPLRFLAPRGRPCPSVPSTPCSGAWGPADHQQGRTLSGLPEGRGGHD